MTHLVGWSALGSVVALAAWLAGADRRLAALAALVPVGAVAAVLSGLTFWSLWEFPSEVVSRSDWLSTPLVISYLVAAVGTLAALSSAIGVMRRADGAR